MNQIEQKSASENEPGHEILTQVSVVSKDEKATIEADFTEREAELYLRTKKNITDIFLESGLAGVVAVLIGFVSCRAPLPMILAAFEVTQAAGEQCKAIAAEVAAGTIGFEFMVGAIAYGIASAVAEHRRKKKWQKLIDKS